MMQSQTMPELFATANGIDIRRGDQSCWYCGASCGAIDENHISKRIKPTCTIYQYIMSPGSEYICDGCNAAIEEKASVQVFDEAALRSHQKTRNYSWVITEKSAIAFTKSHTDALRHLCLIPPRPPFGIVLSNSGQKHLLYMGVVNLSRTNPTILLEEEQITYSREELEARLKTVLPIIAAAGKVQAAKENRSAIYMMVAKRFPGKWEAILSAWEAIAGQPLTRLAVWLSPNKEASNAEFPENESTVINGPRDVQRGEISRGPRQSLLFEGLD